MVAQAKGVGLGQGVEQPPNDADAFQLRERLQPRPAEVVQVLLNNVAAETVEGINADAVGLRTNEVQQPLAHRLDAGIREGEAENVVGSGVGLQQDVPDAGGQ